MHQLPIIWSIIPCFFFYVGNGVKTQNPKFQGDTSRLSPCPQSAKLLPKLPKIDENWENWVKSIFLDFVSIIVMWVLIWKLFPRGIQKCNKICTYGQRFRCFLMILLKYLTKIDVNLENCFKIFFNILFQIIWVLI